MKMTRYNHLNSSLFYFTLLLITVAPFFIVHAHKYLVVPVVLALALFGYAQKTQLRTPFNNERKRFLIATLLFVLFLVFEKAMHGYSSTRLRLYLFALLFVSTVGLATIRIEIIHRLFLLFSFVSAAYVSYVVFYLPTPKSAWIITASTIAALTAAIAALCICTLFTYSKSERVVLIATILLCVLSLVFSSTRTGWVALFASFGAVLVWQRALFIPLIRKHLLAVILLSILAAVLFYWVAETRIVQTINDIKSILSGNSVTSIGLRLEMWKSGLIITEGNTLFGLGENYKETLIEYANAGNIHPHFKVWHPNHLHSEYIDRFAKSGIIGLSLFLSFIGYLIYLARQNTLSIPAVFMLISLLVSGITDRSFELTDVIPFYLIIYCFYISRPATETNV
jgi:O-antigen ligase